MSREEHSLERAGVGHGESVSRPGRGPSILRRFSFRVACCLAGALAALLIGETAVRLFHLDSEFDVVYNGNFQLSGNTDLRYELRPGSLDGSCVISTAGLRDREYSFQKNPRNVFRIVILGDSVTFGYELPQNAAYPKQLEAMLNRYSPPGAPTYEVLNLGVTGYNATQIVEALRVKGLRFEPDLIVYGYVLNDPQAYSVEQEALDILVAQARKRQSVARFLPRFRLLPLLAKHFTSLRINRLPVGLHDPGFVAYEAETHHEYFLALYQDSEAWGRVRDGFADLARLAGAQRRIPVLVAVFPIDEGQGFSPYPLRELHERVMAEAQRNGLHTLDLTPSFQAVRDSIDEELFLDFLHFNTDGARVAAAAILQWLCESGSLPGDGFDFTRVLGGEPFDVEIAAALIDRAAE